MDLQITAITSSSELTKQLTTMAIGNDLPDLVSLDRMYIAEFTEMGIFEDITDRANSDLDLSKFYQGTIDGCTVDGKLYGMPFVANCLAVYYNKDILKANGVAEPADGWTWDDYSAIAQSCANDKEGIYGAIMAGQASTDGTFQYMPWLWMAGGDVYNPANAEPFKTSLNYLSGLIASGAMTPEISNWSQTDASNQFSAGKSALFTGGTWHLTSFKKNIADFEWGVIHYPANPATGEYNTCLGGHGLAICKGGNVDDAWDLIKYIESDEVMGYWNEAQNYIPCRSDIAEASEYFMGDSLISAYTESMAHAKSRGGSNVYIQIDTVIQSMIQEVYTGTMTVDEAVDHYLAEIKSIVG